MLLVRWFNVSAVVVRRFSSHKAARRNTAKRRTGLNRYVERLEDKTLLSAVFDGFSAATASPATVLPAETHSHAAAKAEHEHTHAEIDWSGVEFHPTIVAGVSPDSPSNRVDANTTTSIFAGVGSLFMQTNGPRGFICTGTAISATHVLTAGHCLDSNNNGTIDFSPNKVTFYLNYGGNLTHGIKASALDIHPDFTGFNRPSVNDDVAIVTLSSPLPAGVPIYPIHRDPLTSGEALTLVGYGQSGDGVNGYYVDASFSVKRAGGNRADGFEGQDDAGRPSANEVFYFDFDGPTGNGPLGSSTLGNFVETTLGGGDSGGPGFLGGAVASVNTFAISGGSFATAPLFGSGGGGMIVSSYASWIDSIVGGPVEPPLDAPPSVTLTSPSNGGTVSGTSVNVSANASDDVGIAKVEFFVGNTLIGTDTNGGDGWSVVWDSTSVVDGSYTLKATATDTATQTASHTINITVDNVADPPPPADASMHVADLDAVTNVKGRSGKQETLVTVTIRDSNGSPVANATVSGTWAGAVSGAVSGATGSNGTVTFTTGNYSGSSSLSFTVTDVTGTLTYDSTANTDPDGDSDGTTIVIAGSTGASSQGTLIVQGVDTSRRGDSSPALFHASTIDIGLGGAGQAPVQGQVEITPATSIRVTVMIDAALVDDVLVSLDPPSAAQADSHTPDIEVTVGGDSDATDSTASTDQTNLDQVFAHLLQLAEI